MKRERIMALLLSGVVSLLCPLQVNASDMQSMRSYSTNLWENAKNIVADKNYLSVNVIKENPLDTTKPTWNNGIITASNITVSTATIAWNQGASDNTGVVAYNIYGNNTLVTTVSAGANNCDIGGLSPNTGYIFKAEAVDAAGNSSNNGPTTQITTPVDKSVPTWPLNSSLSFSGLTGTQVTLSWPLAMDDACVASYRIYVDGAVINTVPGGVFTYKVENLLQGKNYNFKVEAGDFSGNWSSNGPTVFLNTVPMKEADRDWETMGPGAGGQILGFWFDPANPSRVFAGSDVAGVWISEDRGENWNYLTKGWRAKYLQDVIVNPKDSRHIFISLEDGIYQSKDLGTSWERYGEPSNVGVSKYFSDMDWAYDADGNFVLYAGTGYARSNNNGSGLVYKKIGNGEWESFKVPMKNKTEAIFSVLVDKNNSASLYISTGEGIFKSVDGGKNWSDITTNLPSTDARKMINDPANFDSLIVVLNNGKVFSKVSGSNTWVDRTGSLSATNLNGLVCDISAPFGAKLYVGSGTAGNCVYYTENGNDANPVWQAVTDNARFVSGWNSVITANTPRINPYSLGIAPNGDIWIGSNGNFHRSSDNAATWVAKYSIMKSEVPASQVTAGTTTYGWEENTWNNTGFSNIFPRYVTVDPNDPNKIFSVFADRNFFVSKDGGKSWQQMRFFIDGVVAGDAFFAKFDPYQKGVVYASGNLGFGEITGKGALFKSTDSGETWSFVAGTSGGVTNVGGLDASNDIWDMAFAPNGNMYVAVRSVGVFESKDGGISWSIIPATKNFYLARVTADPIDSNIIYAACRDDSFKNKGLWKGVKVSEDWTWTRVISDDECWNVQVDPTNTERVYAALSKSGLRVSEDSGKTWNTILTSSGGEGVKGLAIDPDNGYVYASYDGTFVNKPAVVLSKDYGVTWTDISGDNGCPFAWWMEISNVGGLKYLYGGSQGQGVTRLLLPIKEEAKQPSNTNASQGKLPSPTKIEINFNDIKTHWALVNINKLIAASAIGGYTDSSFKPDKTVTRAEFATMLVKAFKLSAQSGKVFAYTSNHWAKDYIATLQNYTIVSGNGEGSFGADDPITREDMVTMLVKAAKLSTSAEDPVFADSSKISDYAKNAIAVAYKKGILEGYDGNLFMPKDFATRAEAVTLIVKLIFKY